jgi:hypothetical protein
VAEIAVDEAVVADATTANSPQLAG